MSNLEKDKKNLNSYAKYSGLGIQMGVIIGAGCYGGYKLDAYTDATFPIWSVVFSVLSFVLALYWVYKQAIK